MKASLFSKWPLAGFFALLVSCFDYVNSAQGADYDDLRRQLKQMEVIVARQQEQIQAIQNQLKEANANIEEANANIEKVKVAKVEKRKPNDFRVYWDKGLRFKTENGKFKLKLGGRIMNDWGWMDEDDDIKRNVGDQVDGTEFRRARLYMSGDIYKNIGFKAQFDFASGGRPDFKDVYMELKKIPVAGNLRVGHFKEPFGLEGLTSSKYITFMERSLNYVFAPGRNTGAMLHNNAFGKRMSWAAGIFRNANGWGDSEGDRTTEGSYSFTTRLTGLPWYVDKGEKLIHVGFSYSYQNAFENALRFRSTPEIHLADRYIDTRGFAAEHSHRFNPEIAYVCGPFSLQAEYTYTDVELAYVDMLNVSDPQFDGFYFYGSYFLTGERRKYDTKKGTFGRVKPNKNFSWGKGLGAIELAARFSSLDLSDKTINGGRMDDISLGLNWYLNPNMRVMLNYVHSDPDYSALALNEMDGNVDLLGMRFQIDF